MTVHCPYCIVSICTREGQTATQVVGALFGRKCRRIRLSAHRRRSQHSTIVIVRLRSSVSYLRPKRGGEQHDQPRANLFKVSHLFTEQQRCRAAEVLRSAPNSCP